MRIFYFYFCCLLLALGSQAQVNNQQYATDNYRPITPGAYSLIKYLDNPTDLYHGMPQVSVPIYTMKVGQKSFPLAFTYHAGGIRVTEEASWVGLGWDMTTPTVIQAINDEDDLTPQLTANITVPRRRPDWPLPNSGYTIALPQRYRSILGTSNQSGSTPGNGWTNPYPSTGNKPAPEAKHYYKSCFQYYIPVNKNFDVSQDQMFNGRVDSEPDVFTVDLFGTHLSFSKNFDTGQIVLLNNGAYAVNQVGDEWEILDGDGYSYHFAFKNVHTVAISDASTYGSSGSGNTPSLVVWYLSSITSPEGYKASFSYTRPYSARTSVDFKQKYQLAVRENTSQNYSTIGEAYTTQPTFASSIYPNYTYPTKSFTYEIKTYLQSIICDNAIIDFYAGDRSDITQARKLDSLHVYDIRRATLLKVMVLNHDYFQANSSVPFTPTFSTQGTNGADTQRNDLRLRLTSLQESTTGTYRFTYDAEPLPPRNSFAQDFWGYYNGAYNNSSLIPSARRLGFYPAIIPDNGNNNGAVLQYARAGILTSMSFPTGGHKSYEYELNTYSAVDSYNNPLGSSHLPDYDSLDNKIIKGNGLRVRRITSYPVTGMPLLTEYTYFNGRTMLPMAHHRVIGYNVINPPTGGTNGNALLDSYTIYEITSNFQYSPALIGSGTGIGYSRVEERQRTLGMPQDQPAGTTVYYYANIPDIDRANDTGFYAAEAGGLYQATQVTLPAYQNPSSKDNGLIDSVYYFTDAGALLRRTVYTYRTVFSPIDYGVKFFSGGVHYEVNQYGGSSGLAQWAKSYVGFYPVFGKHSYKLTETNVDYGTDGTGFARRTFYTFDFRDRLTFKRDQNYSLTPKGTPAYFAPGVTYNYLYPDYRLRSGDIALMSQNRFNELVALTEVHAVDATINPGISGRAYAYDKFYNYHAPITTLDSVIEKNTYPTGLVAPQKVIRYKAYDKLNRLGQLKNGQEVPTAYLWYDQVALATAIIKNATSDRVACTSFETGESANWALSVPSVRGGVTGVLCQPLTNGLTTPTLPGGIYAFSYWTKGTNTLPTALGAYQVQRQQTVARADGWVQYQGTLTPTISNPGTVALQFAPNPTDLLDEVRFYPIGAQMTSYTYGPWQNVMSQTDATGRFTSYEYDALGRLVRTRDEQGRILSQQQYHYAQQP